MQNENTSIVIPAHVERDNIPDLLERVRRCMEPSGRTFEIIVVDDESPNETGTPLHSTQTGIRRA